MQLNQVSFTFISLQTAFLGCLLFYCLILFSGYFTCQAFFRLKHSWQFDYLNCFILRFRLPETIRYDQAGKLENELFYYLDKLTGTYHSRTTPYQPLRNGEVESFNKKPLSMLGTLPEKQDRTGKMKSTLSSSRRINIFQCARSDQCQDQRNLQCYTETCCFLVPTDLLMNLILKSHIG